MVYKKEGHMYVLQWVVAGIGALAWLAPWLKEWVSNPS